MISAASPVPQWPSSAFRPEPPLIKGPAGATLCRMCRSIKTLRVPDQTATDEEIRAAALQFVRKVSGYRQPSKANTEVFDSAVEEIARSSKRLLSSLQTR